jgi:hypothetical protein
MVVPYIPAGILPVIDRLAVFCNSAGSGDFHWLIVTNLEKLSLWKGRHFEKKKR